MNPTNSPALLIPAILVSLAVIIAALYFTHKLFTADMQSSITKIVILILVALSALWIVDKLVFMNRNLLSVPQSDGLFSLISGLVLTCVGVYFGSQTKSKD